MKRAQSTLESWYSGPTLVACLDDLNVPERPIDRPFRLGVVDFFKGGMYASGGVTCTGRVEQGGVQVGETVVTMPAKEAGVVKIIEMNGDTRTWAAAGDYVNLTLTGLDPIHLR